MKLLDFLSDFVLISSFFWLEKTKLSSEVIISFNNMQSTVYVHPCMDLSPLFFF